MQLGGGHFGIHRCTIRADGREPAFGVSDIGAADLPLGDRLFVDRDMESVAYTAADDAHSCLGVNRESGGNLGEDTVAGLPCKFRVPGRPVCRPPPRLAVNRVEGQGNVAPLRCHGIRCRRNRHHPHCPLGSVLRSQHGGVADNSTLGDATGGSPGRVSPRSRYGWLSRNCGGKSQATPVVRSGSCRRWSATSTLCEPAGLSRYGRLSSNRRRVVTLPSGQAPGKPGTHGPSFRPVCAPFGCRTRIGPLDPRYGWPWGRRT